MIGNDLSSYWMPFTANRQFKAAPRLIVSASGIYYRSDDGQEILDGAAGLWCCNAGHGDPRIVGAIQRQAAELDFAPPFQMGHPAAFSLANRLVGLAPPGFEHVFFCNSGSEAVDTALKLALAYHRARGDAARMRFVGRERGYHGVGFGGMAVGGIAGNRRMFGNQLGAVDHLPHTHDPARNAFSQGQPAHGAELADALEGIVALHDASTIAAVIVEPVAGSTGVLVPPAGYLQRLRDICTRHGILLIFDEVITGFGRLGASFAAERFGVVPDLLTMAKGLTGGTVPMGGVLIRAGLFDAIAEGLGDAAIEFAHGYTYSAHPLACAAAHATLDVYRDDDLFARARALEPYWTARLHALKGSRHVTDIRTIGLIAGIELAPRPDAPGQRAYALFTECLRRGLLVRVTGETVALSPPLIVTREQIDRMASTIAAVLPALA